jgi:DNA mismatch repair ATPase MutS
VSNIREVYNFYKELHQEILIFRVEKQYETYFEDAEKISTFCQRPLQKKVDGDVFIPCVTLPVEGILDFVSVLSDMWLECRIISYRNDLGEYDLPDVSKLEREEKSDY